MNFQDWRLNAVDAVYTAVLALAAAYTATLFYFAVKQGAKPYVIILCILQCAVLAVAAAAKIIYTRYINKFLSEAGDRRGTPSEERGVDSTESMVAAVAHELKNPLNSIKGATHYLSQKYKGNSEISEFTGIISSEINRLDRLLNEFMSFSRGTKLKLKKTDIISLVNGVVMLLKHSTGAEIRVVKQNEGLKSAYIDPEQVRQVIVNLVSNAADAVKNTDNPRIDILIDSDGGFLRISVKDNGRGMTPQELKKVFTPFYTTKKEGMGIGLNISRSIVKRHGGEITATSKKGHGSCFTVVMPFEKRAK